MPVQARRPSFPLNARQPVDWDHIRFFLAVHREGSLRAAARRLGVDQTTAGRRLAALERQLGAKLFVRTPAGYLTTPAAEAFLAHAERMEEEASAIGRRAAGMDKQLMGTVRISAPYALAEHWLVPAIAALHQRHPDLRLVLWSEEGRADVAGQQVSGFEADIGIRVFRPTASHLVLRKIGRVATRLYAARSYLSGRGLPAPGTGFAGHDLIVMFTPGSGRRQDSFLGEPIDGGRVVLEVNSIFTSLAAAINGLGIATLLPELAESEPRLMRIWPDREQVFEVWLVVHADVYKAARVRTVMDALIAAFVGKDRAAAE
jgi:DNA-binding transcriptional LysR family regulator